MDKNDILILLIAMILLRIIYMLSIHFNKRTPYKKQEVNKNKLRLIKGGKYDK